MDDKLYKFTRLVEAGSYTRAAKDLHISQPALTVAIQKLEKELGTHLFIRSGRRLELTAAGEATYRAALEHQDVTSELQGKLARLARKRPAITIGMVDSVADRVCATETFDQLEKAADVTLIVNNSRYLRNEVERRRIDVALIIHDELDHQGLTSTVIGKEQLKLVYHPELEPEVAKDLNNGKLDGFISYDKPSTTYRHIHNVFSTWGVVVQTRLYSTSPSLMFGMVLRGKGCAVLPAVMVQPFIDDGRIQTILEPISRPVALVTVANKVLPSYMADFLSEASLVLSEN